MKPLLHKKFDLILLGDPASGKATHGRVLARHYKLYNLDMGHELRMLSRANLHSEILSKTMHKGKLAPTAMVREILSYRICHDPKKRILFNGTPKMIGEARLVSRLLKKNRPANSKVIVLYLHVSKAEMLRRMAHRKETVGTRQYTRHDDTRAALENRFKYYTENIASVVEFFKSQYPFAQINTNASEAKVNTKIFQTIDELIN